LRVVIGLPDNVGLAIAVEVTAALGVPSLVQVPSKAKTFDAAQDCAAFLFAQIND
jgi:hypothetical protein